MQELNHNYIDILQFKIVSNKMSLRLQVQGINNSQLKAKKIRIKAKGSPAGALLSAASEGQLTRWSPPFRVDCSQQDTINFSLFQNWEQQPRQIANTYVNFVTFLKFNKQHLLSNHLSDKYELDLRLNSTELLGKLVIQITFDPLLEFEGQIPQKLSLNLKLNRPSTVMKTIAKDKIKNEIDQLVIVQNVQKERSLIAESGEISFNLKKTIPMEKPATVHFYNGPCKTVNGFSFMDEGAVGQKCSLTQDIYRENKKNNSPESK